MAFKSRAPRARRRPSTAESCLRCAPLNFSSWRIAALSAGWRAVCRDSARLLSGASCDEVFVGALPSASSEEGAAGADAGLAKAEAVRLPQPPPPPRLQVLRRLDEWTARVRALAPEGAAADLDEAALFSAPFSPPPPARELPAGAASDSSEKERLAAAEWTWLSAELIRFSGRMGARELARVVRCLHTTRRRDAAVLLAVCQALLDQTRFVSSAGDGVGGGEGRRRSPSVESLSVSETIRTLRRLQELRFCNRLLFARGLSHIERTLVLDAQTALQKTLLKGDSGSETAFDCFAERSVWTLAPFFPWRNSPGSRGTLAEDQAQPEEAFAPQNDLATLSGSTLSLLASTLGVAVCTAGGVEFQQLAPPSLVRRVAAILEAVYVHRIGELNAVQTVAVVG